MHELNTDLYNIAKAHIGLYLNNDMYVYIHRPNKIIQKDIFFQLIYHIM